VLVEVVLELDVLLVLLVLGVLVVKVVVVVVAPPFPPVEVPSTTTLPPQAPAASKARPKVARSEGFMGGCSPPGPGSSISGAWCLPAERRAKGAQDDSGTGGCAPAPASC
jgi:hypothetical protein